MTYVWSALPFLAAAAACAWAARTRIHWWALVAAGAALLLLTAVFDNIMIALDFFHYAPEHLAGLSIGAAPIEDFAYPIAGALLLPACWHMLRARRRTSPAHTSPAHSSGASPQPPRLSPQVTPRAEGSPSFMRSLLPHLMLSSRPASWINTAYPFGAAYVVVAHQIDWAVVVGVIFFLVPYNMAMYGINDVFDYESDLRNPRKGGIEGALLDPSWHRPILVSAAVGTIPFLLLLMVASGPATWLALAVSMFAVVAYSAPGLRFKERPVLDSITSSTHFVSPAVVGLTLAFDRTEAAVPATAYVVLAAFFLWGMAAHAFGAIQDVVPDREARIASIATALGARATVRLSVALWAMAGVLMLFTAWPGPLAAVIALPYLVISVPWWKVSDEHSAQVNRSWRRFIWLNYFGGFIATMLLILA